MSDRIEVNKLFEVESYSIFVFVLLTLERLNVKSLEWFGWHFDYAINDTLSFAATTYQLYLRLTVRTCNARHSLLSHAAHYFECQYASEKIIHSSCVCRPV